MKGKDPKAEIHWVPGCNEVQWIAFESLRVTDYQPLPASVLQYKGAE